MGYKVLFMYWFIEGLSKAGYIREALEIAKTRYAHMLDGGNATLWESWTLMADKSLGYWEPAAWCTVQGENAFPSYLLTRWISGIRPVEPGMTVLELSIPNQRFKNSGAVLPTPHGNVSVNWSENNGGRSLEITIPPGIQVNLDLDSPQLQSKVTWNSKPVEPALLQSRNLVLLHGRHLLNF